MGITTDVYFEDHSLLFWVYDGKLDEDTVLFYDRVELTEVENTQIKNILNNDSLHMYTQLHMIINLLSYKISDFEQELLYHIIGVVTDEEIIEAIERKRNER